MGPRRVSGCRASSPGRVSSISARPRCRTNRNETRCSWPRAGISAAAPRSASHRSRPAGPWCAWLLRCRSGSGPCTCPMPRRAGRRRSTLRFSTWRRAGAAARACWSGIRTRAFPESTRKRPPSPLRRRTGSARSSRSVGATSFVTGTEIGGSSPGTRRMRGTASASIRDSRTPPRSIGSGRFATSGAGAPAAHGAIS